MVNYILWVLVYFEVLEHLISVVPPLFFLESSSSIILFKLINPALLPQPLHNLYRMLLHLLLCRRANNMRPVVCFISSEPTLPRILSTLLMVFLLVIDLPDGLKLPRELEMAKFLLILPI